MFNNQYPRVVTLEGRIKALNNQISCNQNKHGEEYRIFPSVILAKDDGEDQEVTILVRKPFNLAFNNCSMEASRLVCIKDDDIYSVVTINHSNEITKKITDQGWDRLRESLDHQRKGWRSARIGCVAICAASVLTPYAFTLLPVSLALLAAQATWLKQKEKAVIAAQLTLPSIDEVKFIHADIASSEYEAING